MKGVSKFRNWYPSYVILYFFYFFAMGTFGSILSLYLLGNGKTSTEMSFIVSASGLFTMVLQPLFGSVYDRLKKDHIVSILLLVASAISGILFALTQQTILLFLLNGFAMAFLNSVNPVCERMATQSKFRYGTIRPWGAVGYAAATQVAGLVYDHISPGFNFVLFAISALLTALGFWLIGVPEKSPSAANSSAKKHTPFAVLLKDKYILLFALMSFLFSGVAGASGTYLPLLLQETFGSVTLTSTILFLGTLMELPIILSSDKYMDQLSNRALLLIDFGLLLVQFLCYSLCPVSWLIFLVVFFCRSTATMLFIMVTLKVVLNMTDDDTSTTALSLIATTKTIGSVVFTYLAGFFSDMVGLRAVFVVLLVGALAGFVLAFAVKLPSKDQSLFRG